jgi:hypothetical protein
MGFSFEMEAGQWLSQYTTPGACRCTHSPIIHTWRPRVVGLLMDECESVPGLLTGRPARLIPKEMKPSGRVFDLTLLISQCEMLLEQ